MSHYPPGGPPPYYGYPPPHPPPPSYSYVPTPMMMPMPVYRPPMVPAYPQPPPPTYVTNYIYQHQQPSPWEPVRVVEEPVRVVEEPVRVVEEPVRVVEAPVRVVENADPTPAATAHTNDFIDWVPCTSRDAMLLSHRAVVGGKEGWDNSPLWVIRAHHSGDLVPGKLAIKHRAAYIPNNGKEVPVHNFDLLCAPLQTVRWLPSSNGKVPVGAIPAGNTHTAEPLYIGRTKHRRSITPGKVYPSHGCLYISYDGREIPFKSYEVLCKIVG